MYVTVQFIILEILLGLIFLVVLYFMVRELLKKIIRKEIREIKEPLHVLLNYLAQSGVLQEVDREDADVDSSDERQMKNGPCPEIISETAVDIADEFNQLKNTNRISAYNIRVQKIWDLYKQEKLSLQDYKDELIRLKKEFDIPYQEEGTPVAPPLKPTKDPMDHPLTPTPAKTKPAPDTHKKDPSEKKAG